MRFGSGRARARASGASQTITESKGAAASPQRASGLESTRPLRSALRAFRVDFGWMGLEEGVVEGFVVAEVVLQRSIESFTKTGRVAAAAGDLPL